MMLERYVREGEVIAARLLRQGDVRVRVLDPCYATKKGTLSWSV